MFSNPLKKLTWIFRYHELPKTILMIVWLLQSPLDEQIIAKSAFIGRVLCFILWNQRWASPWSCSHPACGVWCSGRCRPTGRRWAPYQAEVGIVSPFSLIPSWRVNRLLGDPKFINSLWLPIHYSFHDIMELNSNE